MRLFRFLQVSKSLKNLTSDPTYYRRLALKSWLFWRPIVEKMATYEEMERMSEEDMREFDAAIDIQFEKIKAAQNEQLNKNKRG